ncbi:MAG: glutathione S-transferase family protein [Rhodothalassiaceae bacterium]
MPPIRLYGYATSPYVMKVVCYLKFKGLDYQFVPVRPKTNEQIRFTGQKKVPVLQIGEEWRTESSDLGWWLDELAPEPPMDGEDEVDAFKIRDIDAWVSDMLIPSRFREAVDWEDTPTALKTGWRLASIVHAGTPLPLHWRLLWPLAVRQAPFIQEMVNDLSRSEPVATMRRRLMDEFEAHLGEGPYLGARKRPSLADLSAYPVLISGWLMGLGRSFAWLERPAILAWMERVQSHLPANPLACPDRFLVRPFPWQRRAA